MIGAAVPDEPDDSERPLTRDIKRQDRDQPAVGLPTGRGERLASLAEVPPPRSSSTPRSRRRCRSTRQALPIRRAAFRGPEPAPTEARLSVPLAEPPWKQSARD